jgi:hypothetical protein
MSALKLGPLSRQLQAVVVPLIALLMLEGCVTSQQRYYAPAKSEQDLLKARLQCFSEIHKSAGKAPSKNNAAATPAKTAVDCGPVNACLAAKGFLPSEKGNLALPDGASLECND